MRTITIEINDMEALKAIESLERSQAIRVIEDIDIDSPALPGKPMSIEKFREWINDSENSGTISLAEAKSKWQRKREKFLK